MSEPVRMDAAAAERFVRDFHAAYISFETDPEGDLTEQERDNIEWFFARAKALVDGQPEPSREAVLLGTGG